MKPYELLNNVCRENNIELYGFADLSLLAKIKREYEYYNGSIPFFRGKFSDRLVIKNEWEKAESVIVFALSYNFDDDKDIKYSGDYGLIAKCARGEDYHKVLKTYAERLMADFCEVYPCDYVFNADTGVLSDKILAYAAGLGFIGKNNLLINETYGSFVYIGHILLDIPVEGVNVIPISEKCRECNKCIVSCPNRAYLNENCYKCDNCISYLSQISKEYDKTNYIYGCDICQTICPYNISSQKSQHEEFKSSPEVYNPKLTDIINLSEEDFKNTYGNSSLAWRGKKTLIKNCLNILKR